MTASPYQHLAREFLDLWQKQMSAVITDKQFIQSMLDMVQSLQPTGHANARSSRHSATANAANASAADDGVLAQLTYRLVMCEKRIAELERQLKKRQPSASTRATPGSRRGSKKPRRPSA